MYEVVDTRDEVERPEVDRQADPVRSDAALAFDGARAVLGSDQQSLALAHAFDPELPEPPRLAADGDPNPVSDTERAPHEAAGHVETAAVMGTTETADSGTAGSGEVGDRVTQGEAGAGRVAVRAASAPSRSERTADYQGPVTTSHVGRLGVVAAHRGAALDLLGREDVDGTRAVDKAQLSRREQLDRIPARGYKPDEINRLRGILDASGLPIHRITAFERAKDKVATDAHGKPVKSNVIASMVTSGEGRGTFTTHEVYERLPDEGRKAVAVHEVVHSLTPRDQANDEVYGGRAGRLEMVRLVGRVVDQSLITNVHLNGYHKLLLTDYRTVETHLLERREAVEQLESIQDSWSPEMGVRLAAAREQLARAEGRMRAEHARLVEETGAIMTEMSIFNRTALAEVQARQHQVLGDLARIGHEHPDSKLLPQSVRDNEGRVPKEVDLITDPGNPVQRATGGGADQITIRLLQGAGVQNHADLLDHIARFKGEDWGKQAA